MRRWLVVLAVLLGLSPAAAFWQSRDSNYNIAVSTGGFTPSCSQSSAFLARASGITSNTDKTNYDTLICGMVTDGTFAKMDALYIFAAPDQTTALLNLVSTSFPGTTAGTVSFSAKHGFTGDASTFHIITGLTPSTGGTQFTQNSASMGVYDLSSRTTNDAFAMIGGDAATQNFLRVRYVSGDTKWSVNGAINSSTDPANVQGFWFCTYTASTTGVIYRNGSSFDTSSVATTGLDTVPIWIFDQDNGGTTPVVPSGDQFSAAFIGGGLTGTDASNLSSRINTFMTAYGINVF
jgi:hypothetical protein